MRARSATRGACPGPWTPMASGDGWLVRVRTGAQALGSDQLRALARLARAHGSGVIELTRRANLQLRGLRSESIPELRAELIALGLADASPSREGRPALLVDPLAELDARSTSGLAELAQAVDGALAASARRHALSPKLGVVIDAGSGCLTGIDADIRIELRGAAQVAWLLASTQAGAELIGVCETADVPAVVSALLAELAAFHGAAPRMRDFVQARGVASLRARVPAAALPPAPAAPRRAALGYHAQGAWFGFGVPFGSAAHERWLAVADLAQRFGRAEVRLTPAREIVIPGVRPQAAVALAQAVRALGFITAEDDPRRRIVACAGAPACSSAHGETRALASVLATALRPQLAAGATLHVSGCAKGCASRAAAEWTVVLAAGGARLALDADVAAASAAAVEPLAALQPRLAALSAPVVQSGGR